MTNVIRLYLGDKESYKFFQYICRLAFETDPRMISMSEVIKYLNDTGYECQHIYEDNQYYATILIDKEDYLIFKLRHQF